MRMVQKIVLVLLLVGAIFYGGFWLGKASVPAATQVVGLSNMEAGKPADVDFEPFWKVWNAINDRYVAVDGVDTQEKVWGAIQGLAASLGDPYTVFMPPEESQSFEEMITGSFGGVGMEIGEREGQIVVIAPLKGTPAETAGIRAGDALVSINEESTAALTVDEAVGKIRGEPGTVVTLGITREGSDEILSIPVTRDTISIPTLDTEVRGNTFIISLYNFDALSASEFRNAMGMFERSSADRLILDMRGNPGGFLDAAVSIASYFIPAGEVIVAEHADKAEEDVVHRSRGFTLKKEPKKMVVLVDGGSASASEIVAGALQEHGRALLVGTQTFGKGSVQELIPITLSTSLKLTVAQWLTPNGVSISEGGLTPDVVVDVTPEDIEAGRDLQLERALQEVEK